MKRSVIRARMNLKIPRAPLYFKGNEISLKAPLQTCDFHFETVINYAATYSPVQEPRPVAVLSLCVCFLMFCWGENFNGKQLSKLLRTGPRFFWPRDWLFSLALKSLALSNLPWHNLFWKALYWKKLKWLIIEMQQKTLTVVFCLLV